ncbi:MAG: hypothetical protein AB7S26_30575 [Sandaracinaceae bacterium]
MTGSPLAQVKERFGSKEDLVKAVRDLATDDLWLDRVSEDKGLERVSNAKLLRLHATLSAVTKEFSSRSALLDAICKAEKRTDAGYRERLERWPLPRLYDRYVVAQRRAS